MTETHSFDPFAKEAAYIRVNERLMARMLRPFKGAKSFQILDIAAGTGLMTSLADSEAKKLGIQIDSTLLDIDIDALHQARIEVTADPKHIQYLYASAFDLPIAKGKTFDAVIFANSLHLLDDGQKKRALAESMRVLRPGGVVAFNSTFYDGAYPEESKPFYSRWIRRSIVEINQRLPNRNKGDKVQAMEWLNPQGYKDLFEGAGFKISEVHERRVLLSQAAVRAISSYKDFAMGALHASEEDAGTAAAALQATVRQTFNDLKMKYLPRNWLEIIAIKA